MCLHKRNNFKALKATVASLQTSKREDLRLNAKEIWI
jgi:hypothetical protein